MVRTGPRFAVIKKGEHGALLFTSDGVYPIPAFPSKDVRDPTGAGDSFAGGFMGYLAQCGQCDTAALRRAMLHGTVAASFTIEDFSLDRVRNVKRVEIDQRVDLLTNLLRFD